MKNNRKKIAIDMDGVLADIDAHFVSWYAKEYNEIIPREQRRGVPESESFPDKTAVQRYVRTYDFFRTAPLMPGAVEAVKALMERYDVFIVSAAMEFPLSLSEKLQWLNEHFPFISWKNIVFCGDKSIIDADYMIDDHCKNLDSFKGKALLFDAAHNVNVAHHQRCHSWDEILTLL